MSETRAPSRNCENRSRPDSSVPIQCALDGPAMRCAKSKLLDESGSCGARSGPRCAISTTIEDRDQPERPERAPPDLAHVALTTDPNERSERMALGAEQPCDRLRRDRHQLGRTRGSRAMMSRSATRLKKITAADVSRKTPSSTGHVAVEQRVVGELPDSRPGEDRLDEDDAADDVAHRDRGQRDGRQQRVRAPRAAARRAAVRARSRARSSCSPRRAPPRARRA